MLEKYRNRGGHMGGGMGRLGGGGHMGGAGRGGSSYPHVY